VRVTGAAVRRAGRTSRGPINDRLDRARHDVDHDVAGHRDETRGAERIDVAAETELVLDERLDPRAGSAGAAVAEPHDDVIAGIEVAVDRVDDDGFLKRPLVALLVEAHFQRLHRGRALAGEQRPA
jgi:hypothetical protein